MVIVDEKRIFIHIPKTGGTSINQRYIQTKGIKTKVALPRHPFIIHNGKRSEWHFTYDRAYTQFPDYEYFTVIRNPLDRWVSVYKHFLVRKLVSEGLEKWTEKVMKTLPAFDFLDSKYQYDYTQYEKFIHPQWMYYREPEVQVHTIETIWSALGLTPQHIKKGIDIPDYNGKEVRDMIYNFYRKDFKRWQTIE